MNAVAQYARMAADARIGEELTTTGDARCFTVSFPSFRDATAFIRLAGGADPVRVYCMTDDAAHGWRWTMPDGLYAVLVDGESVASFTNSTTDGEPLHVAGWRMEGGDK